METKKLRELTEQETEKVAGGLSGFVPFAPDVNAPITVNDGNCKDTVTVDDGKCISAKRNAVTALGITNPCDGCKYNT